MGVENFVLTPIVVNFAINGFVYNKSNTGLIVRFSNKVIIDILFGGLENGVAVLFSGTDDFFFRNSASENLGVGVLHYSTQTDPRIFASERSPMAVNFTEFQVPEPSTVAIFALGLIGLFFVRWRLSRWRAAGTAPSAPSITAGKPHRGSTSSAMFRIS